MTTAEMANGMSETAVVVEVVIASLAAYNGMILFIVTWVLNLSGWGIRGEMSRYSLGLREGRAL